MPTDVVAAVVGLLRRVWCQHVDALLEQDAAGVWHFVCRCGHRAPVIRRDR